MCSAYGFLCVCLGKLNSWQAQKERGRWAVGAERNFLNNFCVHGKMEEIQHILTLNPIEWRLVSLNKILPQRVSPESEDSKSLAEPIHQRQQTLLCTPPFRKAASC